MPNDDASGDGNVKRVLGAELGNLQTAVAGIDHFLMDALDLIAEDDSIFLIGRG